MVKNPRAGADSKPAASRWRRWALLLLVAVALFELLYLVAGNLAINSDWLQARINRRPVQWCPDQGVNIG
jgi:hypothetical protein